MSPLVKRDEGQTRKRVERQSSDGGNRKSAVDQRGYSKALHALAQETHRHRTPVP